jgi:translocation and assembly module TamB
MDGGEGDSRASAPAGGFRPSGPRRSRSRWRRVFRALAFVFLIAFVALAVLYAFRTRLVAPILVDLASRRLEASTGMTLSIEEVGGDWYRDLEVRGLSLAGGTPDRPKVTIEIREARAQFSLGKLLRGELDGLERVDASGVLARIDLRGAKPAAQPVPPQDIAWPERLPALAIDGLDFELWLSDRRRIAATGASIAAPGGGDFSADIDELRVVDTQAFEHAARAHVVARYRAGELDFEEISLDGEKRLGRSSLDLTHVARGDLAFTAELFAFGGRTTAAGAIRARHFAMEWSTEAVAFDPVWRFFLPRRAAPAQAIVDATGKLELAFDEPNSFRVSGRGAIRGGCLEGRELEFPEVDVEYGRGVLSIARAVVEQDRNRLTAAQLYVPLFERDWRAALRKISGWVDVELYNLPDLAAPSAVESAVRVPLHRARATASLFEGTAEIDAATLATRGGDLYVRRGIVRLAPDADASWLDTEVDLDLDLDFQDLAAVGALWKRAGWGGSLRGGGRIAGALRAPTGRFELVGRGVSAEGLDVGDLDFAARADRQRLLVERLHAEGQLARADASGELDFATLEFRGVRLDLESDAWWRFLPRYVESGSLRVGLEGSGTWLDPHASFALSARDVFFGEQFLGGRRLERLDAHGRVDGPQVLVEALDARAGGVDVSATLEVEHRAWSSPFLVDLERLTAARDELDLALVEPVRVIAGPGLLIATGLAFSGSAGKLSTELDIRGRELRASVVAQELYAMRLIGGLLPRGIVIEGVRGSLEIAREAGELTAQSAMSIERLKWEAGGIEAALEAHGHLAEHRVELDALQLAAPDRFSVALTGSFPVDFSAPRKLGEGPIAARGEIALADLSPVPWEKLGVPIPWTGTGRASFDLRGTLDALRGSIDLTTNLQAPPEDTTWNQAELARLLIHASLTVDDAVRIERALVEIPGRATADVRGVLSTSGDARAWLDGPRPDWRAIPVDVFVRTEAQDLAFLPRVATMLRRTAGALDAEVQLTGRLGAPVVTGSVHIKEGEVRLENDLPPLSQINAELVFDRDRVRIASFTGALGAAPMRVTGEVALDGKTPIFDVAVEGDRILIARTDDLRLRSDARLTFRGPIERIQVGGVLDLRDGRYTRDVAFFGRPGQTGQGQPRQVELFRLRNEPWASVEFDVRVRSTEPFRIDNNLVRGSVRPELRLVGTGAAPELVGTVFLDPTRVSLPATTILFDSGTITFGPPDPLVPTLALNGQTRVLGYDVTVNITGSIAEPEVVLSSVPPLSNEELAVLVLTGQPPRSTLTGKGGEEAAQTVAVYLGKDVVTRWFGSSDDGGESFLDRLEWRHGADVSKSGVESTEFSMRLTPDRRDRMIYVRAEQDVYERINFGIRFLFRVRK